MLDRINALTSPVARMLLTDLYNAWTDAIVIPNTILPKSKHGDEVAEGYELAEGQQETLGRSASSLLTIVQEDLDKQDVQEFLGQKESRLREYEQAIEDNRRIEFREYTCVLVENTRQLLEAIG